ncbi:MAG: VWA domain-containing protein [Acidobacteriota bacterium]|nr:VWA domain-containing protein [Acidobacteriota bacterium]
MILRRTLRLAPMPLIALLSVLGVALSPAASRATEAQTTFTEKIEVNLVDLNVVVTTLWGRPVTDLTRDDFEIWEDGELRPISHFIRVIDGVPDPGTELSTSPSLTPPKESPPRATQPSYALDRSIVLAFDTGIQRPYMRRALKAARDFVAERSEDGIWWSVVMLAARPHSLLPLTNDAREVVSTLESILARNKAGTRFQVPTQAVARTADLDGEWSRLVLTEQSLTYPYAARNLSEIFRAYASVPGSKACVIYQQGRGGTFATELSGRRSCLFPCRPQVQLSRHLEMWRDLSRQATSAGFKAYVMDVRGLNHEAGSSASRLAWYSLPTSGPSFGPTALAYHTGGEHFALNDLDEAVRAAARETGTYYSLAFAAPHDHDGKPHDLKVRVPGRTWLEVRSSSGFFDVDPRTLLVERLASPAHFPKAGGALPLTLQVASHEVEGAEVNFIATATTPVENLTLLPENGTRIADVDLFLAVHDSTGALVSLKQDRGQVRAPGAAKEAELSVPLSLRLPTGRYTFTVALYDPVSGLSGAASAHVGGPEPRGDV